MFKRIAIALATVAALTGAAHAGVKVDKATASKLMLHQLVCGGQSDRMKAVTIKAALQNGGVEKLLPAVVRLKADIKREADLGAWCEMMNDQVDTLEAAWNLKED